MRTILTQIVLVLTLLGANLATGQEQLLAANFPTSGSVPFPLEPPAPVIANPVIQPCAKPAGLMDVNDYSGPFSGLVLCFSQKLERQTVRQPSRKSRLRPCSLDAREKFNLFVEDSIEPVNFLDAGWDAAWAQHDRDDPKFGPGIGGFSKRYKVAVTDNVAGEFFNTFLYPSLFHQDPRYYRLERGSAQRRLFHAMRHVFVAHNDDGRLMFNYSEWFGTFSSKALSNLYHPGNERGLGTTAQRAGMGITSDMAMDVLKEFWPEISRKCHLPFKRRDAMVGTAPGVLPVQKQIAISN